MRFSLLLPAVCGVLLSACGRYDDFSLPPLDTRNNLPAYRWRMMSEPVLGRGAPGNWDSVDVLNPAVVSRGGVYYNLYSGYDGKTWHTGLATSPDGIRWTRKGRVLSPEPATWEGDYIAANGSALIFDGQFWYWYQAGVPPRIGLAKSTDGQNWEKLSKPVLETGPRGSWDERGVADPFVARVNGVFYMYYLGQDRARRQRLGVARSDNGIDWWKLRANPVLELGPAGAFDEVGLGEPAVWQSHGHYWMLYTARDAREHRRLGLAVSVDGVAWKRVSGAAVLEGTESWNSKVVCDPDVEVLGDTIRVWFGGGDQPEPAENLTGQIGLATLHLGEELQTP